MISKNKGGFLAPESGKTQKMTKLEKKFEKKVFFFQNLARICVIKILQICFITIQMYAAFYF